MFQLLELYRHHFSLDEMARTRGDATWAVLDWCAKQTGDFTISDMYRVYAAAGGQSEPTQFATLINRFVSKYDPNAAKEKHRNKEKYGFSQKRPLVITRQGRRGKGGATTYQWGLDGPLRELPPDSGDGPDDNADDSPVAVAMDSLEKLMGAPALKAAMQRWKSMKDLRMITADIKGSVPPRGQMDAMLIATEPLMSSGRADASDVEDAEDSLAASGATSAGSEEPPTRTPFAPGKPRPEMDRVPGYHSGEPEGDDDPAAEWADDSGDKTQPDATNPFEAETDPDVTPAPEADGHEGPDGDDGEDETEEYDVSDYPDWLPPARKRGTPGERSMFRLVDAPESGGAGLAPDDGLWEVLEGAEDEREAAEGVRALFSHEKRDRRFLPDALAVAREVLSGTSEDEGDGGEGDGSDAAEEPEGAPESEPDGGSSEDSPEDAPEEASHPDWLPHPDEDGSNSESAMFRLTDEAGLDENDPIYTELRNSKDSVDAHRIISSSRIPKNLTKAALTVAKAIFQHDGRDWDTGKKAGGVSKKEGLSRIYGLCEMTDDDGVPSPSKRPVPGPGRIMPNFGMDEGPNTEPVDFAVKSGLKRVLKLGRSRLT